MTPQSQSGAVGSLTVWNVRRLVGKESVAVGPCDVHSHFHRRVCPVTGGEEEEERETRFQSVTVCAEEVKRTFSQRERSAAMNQLSRLWGHLWCHLKKLYSVLLGNTDGILLHIITLLDWWVFIEGLGLVVLIAGLPHSHNLAGKRL